MISIATAVCPRTRHMLVITVVAVFATLFLENGPAPWAHVVNGDWDVISAVGRRMAYGELLYVDVWEQKGPLLYAVWMLLWQFGGTYEMVALLECVLAFVLLAWTMCVLSDVMCDLGSSCRVFWLLIAFPFLFSPFPRICMLPGMHIAELYILPALAHGVRVLLSMAQNRRIGWWHWLICGIGAAVAILVKYPSILLFAALIICVSITWYRHGKNYTLGFGKGVGVAFAAFACVIVISACIMLAYGMIEGFIRNYFGFSATGYKSMCMTLFGMASALLDMSLVAFARLIAFGWLAYAALRRRFDFSMTLWPSFFAFAFYWSLRSWPVYGIPIAVFFPFALSSFGPIRDLGQIPAKALRFALAGTILAMPAIVDAHHLGKWLSIKPETKQAISLIQESFGNTDSVYVGYFHSMYLYETLGLESRSAIPAMVNAVDDTSIQEAIDDISHARWEVVVLPCDEGFDGEHGEYAEMEQAVTDAGYEMVYDMSEGHVAYKMYFRGQGEHEETLHQNHIPKECGSYRAWAFGNGV